MLSVRRTGHGGFVSGTLKVAMVAMLKENLWGLWNDPLAFGRGKRMDVAVRGRSVLRSIMFSHQGKTFTCEVEALE